MISSHFPVDYYQEKMSLLYLKSRIVVMTTEDLLQNLLVDDHSLDVPALPADLLGVSLREERDLVSWDMLVLLPWSSSLLEEVVSR